MQEIEESVSLHRFRNLFAILLIKNSPSNMEELFEKYQLNFFEDCTYTHLQYYDENLHGEKCWSLSLYIIHQLFKELSLCYNPLEQYMLPNISSDHLMEKRIVCGILSNPDGPTFHKNIINPEIIEESLSN